MNQNQNEKMISNFIEVNGIGSVMTKKGVRDVFVYGYFTVWDRFSFIVHADVWHPEFCTVSEASTGCRLLDETYYSVEDALYYAYPFILSKHYYFATAIGNWLVRTQKNLLKRNTTLLQTLAIDSLLW